MFKNFTVIQYQNIMNIFYLLISRNIMFLATKPQINTGTTKSCLTLCLQNSSSVIFLEVGRAVVSTYSRESLSKDVSQNVVGALPGYKHGSSRD